MQVFFVELILPLALPGTYTYHADEILFSLLKPGQRVVVQFGKHKIYSALVWKLNADAPSFETKPIIELLDELPVISQLQMQLWQWMTDYYLCTLGEVMAAALPSTLRLQSESILLLNENYDKELLNAKELALVEALEENKQLTIAEASKLLNLKQVMPVVKSLLLKSIVLISEQIEKFKPRTTVYVSLTKEAGNEEFLRKSMDAIEKRSPKQLDLLLAFLNIVQDEKAESIPRTKLLKKAKSTASVLNALIKKNIFALSEGTYEKRTLEEKDDEKPAQLNEIQTEALQAIRKTFSAKKVSLLHGITSSGKTEIYIHLLEEAVSGGKQALYLLPEIALTTQMIQRLKRHFGMKLHVYHSRFSDNERVEVWNKVLLNNSTDGEGMIVIGARSSVFLPFEKLSLVIVDEEHDSSYKQSDPSPRYNARDTSVWIGSAAGASILLGTATPSVESYYNALAEKYILTSVSRRYGEFSLPEVVLIDLREALKRKKMNSHFSSQLLDEVKLVLSKGEQVILFQNRRGFAPVLECRNCSWVPHCINCDVSLTLHKQHQELRCHYCGYATKPPSACNACGSNDLRMKGFGTEKIEEELKLILPESRIARLDHDTAKSRRNFHQLMHDFDEGEIDILVGTQMVTKGLDFKNVSLVGILNADQLLNYPDFRSQERSFQLMEQVSGRAGRKKAGKVLIQTYNPSNAILQYVVKHDYRSFYNYELIERNRFNYPPYYRLIECLIKHKNEKEAERASKDFAGELTSVFGKRVLGPTHPNISRIRNYHIRQILIKLEKKLSVAKVKQQLLMSVGFFRQRQENKNVILHIDVDPL